ncbi:hypothetical protein L226DRAFT_608556 [Lentinus tigrinus ALCF2SS1-7]|uniref:F-box domain-containing protein n=1 Tax=Lentinus tigrinus ALCF2SS1-6 TaxID=1328759 RepID=A0A5C2SXF1_9APHY|nr:hypothetical protein L227DRAFT_605747 [Lentinus tigrinus ALCF2SS1-6]RPD81299.1 hypothetical protein L226DRAFT_608556 [Lentinus tigrinus ALCF2SS1-7]
MDNLAPEILHEIFRLACTDGGFTGCSLSLVSKHVKLASRSARFHSVAISGTSRQLADFLSLLTKEQATAGADGYTPVVKHLFFSAVRSREIKEDRRVVSKSLLWENDRSEDRVEKTAIGASRGTYLQDVDTLFRLLAQGLETLSFIHCHGWATLTRLSGIECPGGFPVLRELTIVGNHPFVGAVPSVFYPSLTHLHLDFPSWLNEPSLWAERSPHVTHLCLSNINHITQPLEDLASTGNPFKELSRLYVQPEAPPAPGGWCGNPYMEHAMFMCDFAIFPHTATIPTHSLRHREGNTENWTRKEWLGRIGGGFGCWIPFEPKMDDTATSARHELWDGSLDRVEEFILSLVSPAAEAVTALTLLHLRDSLD